MPSLASDRIESDRHTPLELSQLAIRSMPETGINRMTHTEVTGRGHGNYWLLSFSGSRDKRVHPVNCHLPVLDTVELGKMLRIDMRSCYSRSGIS